MDETRVSILGVAAERLPYYLAVFALVVVLLLGYAAWKCWDSIEDIARYYTHLLDRCMPALVTMLVAVEGVIMGLNEIRTRQLIAEARREERRKTTVEAREEGIREGMEEAIRKLESAGNREAAQILRGQ